MMKNLMRRSCLQVAFAKAAWRLPGIHLRSWLLWGAVLLAFPVLPGAAEPAVQIFRIGTGGSNGVYFPVGNLLAEAINLESEAASGLPVQLVAAAQVSNGSVSNVNALRSGRLEAGLVQADVAHWAYTGTGIYSGGAYRELRAISNLHSESIHLVARRSGNFESVVDLKGQRVSLDEAGSGTLEEARIILGAFGLDESDIDARYVKLELAVKKLQRDELDAFFVVSGYPVRHLAELAKSAEIDLVPITGEPLAGVLEQYPHLFPGVIPAGVYPGVDRTPTLRIGAQLVVDEALDDGVVYRVTRALWSERARALLDQGHPVGRTIRRDRALKGLSVPLHAGAKRYFRELDLLEADD